MSHPINATKSSSSTIAQTDATVSPVTPGASLGGNAMTSRSGTTDLMRKMGDSSNLTKRETVTLPENIPQRDRALSTLIRPTRNPTEKAQGFTPVTLDANQQAALKLTELGLTADKNGFVTSSRTGLRARIFQDDAGKYVLSFSGTDGASPSDWNNNLRQAAGASANQYNQAMNLALNLKALYREDFTETTGHSLGGGLAAAAATVTGVKAITFNAGGLNPATVRKFLATRGESGRFDESWAAVNQNTTNYHVLGDAITHLQTDLDASKILPDAIGKQVTLAAVDDQGIAHNQYSLTDVAWRERNRIYLHLAPAIMRGMGVLYQG